MSVARGVAVAPLLLSLLLLLLPSSPALCDAPLANVTLSIEALAKDCERSIVWFVEECLRLRPCVTSLHITILESASSDATPRLLSHLSALHAKELHVVRPLLPSSAAGALGPFHPYRFHRLATLRNAVREAALSRAPALHNTVHVVIDADVRGAWSARSLLPLIARRGGGATTVVCANGRTPGGRYYYDTLAFRSTASGSTLLDAGARARAHITAPLSPPSSLRSCFGGLAVYTDSDAFRTCRYDARRWECEHVTLHACLLDRDGDTQFRISNRIAYLYGNRELRVARRTLEAMGLRGALKTGRRGLNTRVGEGGEAFGARALGAREFDAERRRVLGGAERREALAQELVRGRRAVE